MKKTTTKGTSDGLRSEFHNIRWQKLKPSKNDPGALKQTGKVIVFSAAWALMFVLVDALLSVLMHI